jgi:IPT/TIG domain
MPTYASEGYSSKNPLETRDKNTYSSRKPPEAIVGPDILAQAPVLDGLNPASLPVPGPDAWIVVHGSGFFPGSVIVWNDQDVETEYVNEGEVRTQIQMTAPGIDPVYVRNGGLKSNVLDFTFTEAEPAPEEGETD